MFINNNINTYISRHYIGWPVHIFVNFHLCTAALSPRSIISETFRKRECPFPYRVTWWLADFLSGKFFGPCRFQSRNSRNWREFSATVLRVVQVRACAILLLYLNFKSVLKWHWRLYLKLLERVLRFPYKARMSRMIVTIFLSWFILMKTNIFIASIFYNYDCKYHKI